MIYVLISDGRSREITEQTEKRDCRLVRQPLSLLPTEIKEYIENTKNDSLRLERRLAYTSLFCGLTEFFGIDNAKVKRSKDKKPYIVINSDDENCLKNNFSPSDNEYQKNKDFDCFIRDNSTKKSDEISAPFIASDSLPDTTSYLPHISNSIDKIRKIHISISHSDGVSAVCLSDEGCVGVDIQSEIDRSRLTRLNERFFPALYPVCTDFEVKYYFCFINEVEATLELIDLTKAEATDETARWAYFESLIKLSGGGFGDLKLLSDLVDETKTQLKRYENGASFLLATSVYKTSVYKE